MRRYIIQDVSETSVLLQRGKGEREIKQFLWSNLYLERQFQDQKKCYLKEAEHFETVPVV